MKLFWTSRRIDLLLIASACLLTIYSPLGIYTASALKSVELYQQPHLFFQKQALASLFGFLLIFIINRIPFSWISKFTLPLFVLTLTSLLLIYVPGAYSKVGGATRWLNIVGIRFQPGELTKIALVFFLAKNLSRKNTNINDFWRGVFPNFLILALVALLLLKQPDFGTAALLTVITVLMLYVAGMSRRVLLATTCIGISTLAAAVIVSPYRVKRVLAYLDPWNNVQHEGFQIIQSYLAFRNGGLWGLGLGSSKQKLFFLPEAHTDFIPFRHCGRKRSNWNYFCLYLVATINHFWCHHHKFIKGSLPTISCFWLDLSHCYPDPV